MKLYYLFFLLLCSTSLPITVISLGQNCSAAAGLRSYGIRTAAYPFDWIVSNFDSLYKALADDFVYFLHPESLKLRADKRAIIDYYDFEFLHDFPTIKANISDSKQINDDPIEQDVMANNWRDFIDAVRTKYLRRIERLRTLLRSSEKVYLVRHFNTGKSQAILLRDLLHKKYPFLDFILIIVGNSPDLKQDWNTPRIKNFYLNDATIWNDPNQWKEIFKSLGLIAQETVSSC